jgi:hypothetical protein
MVQLPGGAPFHAPEGQVLTLLPGEAMPSFLCSICDVHVRRKLVPALEEIDEDDNVVAPGLRLVPNEPEEQE